MKKGFVATLLAMPLTSLFAVGFDYRAYDRALAKTVDAQGHVDYAALAAAPADLDAFLSQVAKDSPESNPALFPTWDDELAYWINAYNALTLKSVTRDPLAEDIRKSEKTKGMFAKERRLIGQETYTLDDLEKRIIQKRYTEPRTYFVLHRAAVGGPPLRRAALQGQTLKATLDQAARDFINDPKRVRLSAAGLELSPILKRAKGDLLDYLTREKDLSKPTLLDFLALYVSPDTAAQFKGKKIQYMPYDNRLDGTTIKN